MKRFIFLLLTVISLAGLSVQLSAQGQNKDNTLLWEISGNGLEEPSYLYGTMHIYDRRAFDFSDSVLLKFEQCTAFAAELVFDDALRDLIRYYSESQATDDTITVHKLPEITVNLSSTEELRDTTAEQPITIATPDDDAISLAVPDNDEVVVATPDEDESARRSIRRTVPDMFLERYDSWEPGESPIVVDAYLYRLAKKERKKIIGLETADEQLKALNDGKRGESWKSYLSSTKRLRKLSEGDFAETMIRQYRMGEVGKLHDFLEQNFPPALYRRMIVERNRRMAERGEPHIRREPTFIAVGAGHLAGKDGLIQLFRDRGYTVRPVQAVRTGLARYYREPELREEWPRFSSTVGAYSVEMPAEPIAVARLVRAFAGPDEEADTSMQFWTDVSTGISYFTGYIDLPYEVEFLQDDAGILRVPYTAQFDESDLIRLPAEVVRGEIKGYELTLAGSEKKISRRRYIPRGNRMYFLQAETVPEAEMSEDIERFFGSFTEQGFVEMKTWAYTSQEGQFTAVVPATPSESVDTLLYPLDYIDRNFTAIDKNSGSIFSIRVFTLSEYFHAESEDSLFNEYVAAETEAGDSVMSVTPVDVEGFPGRDMELVNERTGFTMRVRFILRGNNMYTLRTSAPRDRIFSEPYKDFFNRFSMNGRAPDSDIYSDKSGKILADLASDNPDIRSRAGRALLSSNISGNHFPALHALLMDSMSARDSSYDGARAAILMKLADLRDSSAIDMIRTLYPRLRKESDTVRTAALSTLAAIGTEESVTLFRDLILAGPPGKDAGSYGGPFNNFYGNTQASRYFYPDILRLLNHREYQVDLYWLTLEALEDSVVTPAVLAPYAVMITDSLREISERRAAALHEDEEENFYAEAYMIHTIAGCARYLPATSKLQAIFGKLAEDPDNTLAYYAILGLVRQGDTVDDDMIEKLADDPKLRVKLYAELQQIGRLDLFPAEHRNQKSIAEAHLVKWLTEQYEYAPSDVQFLEEREVEVKGVRGRVLLFKYAYNDDVSSWYAAISGLQPLEREELALTADVIGSQYKELGSQSIDQHFTELMQWVESSQKEQ